MRRRICFALSLLVLSSALSLVRCRCSERGAHPDAADAAKPAAPRPATPELPERGPLAQKVLYAQAKTLLNAGRSAEAEQLFRRALAAQSRGLEAANCHLGIAAALADQGRHAEAVTAYRDVVRLRPGDAEARRALAVGLEEAGDLEGAQEALKQALVLDADQLSGYQDLAALQLRGGDEASAKETYERYERRRVALLAVATKAGATDARLAALEALADARDEQTARALAGALGEPDRTLRLAIVAALGRQGLGVGAEALRGLLARTEAADERRTIELSLEAIGAASAGGASDGPTPDAKPAPPARTPRPK